MMSAEPPKSGLSVGLCDTASFKAGLVYYPPGLHQTEHEHGSAQVSVLLVGDVHEVVGAREAEISTAACCVKPAGASHEVKFGMSGALMLAFDLSSGSEFEKLDSRSPWNWTALQNQAAKMIGAALDRSGESREEMLFDVLALLDGPSVRISTPPGWLKRARDFIAEVPQEATISSVAAHVGVHRVHLSRSFTTAFGVAPSVYRSRCMAARGVAAILNRDGLVDAASFAGFSDQSHMARIYKRHLCLTPGTVRGIFR